MTIATRYISWMDKFAVSTSTICAVHCICLPLLLGVFPAIGTTLLGEEVFHERLLWAVIPLSLAALSLGCAKHKDRSVLMLGLLGVAVLIFTASAGHAGLGEFGERTMTLVGAFTIAVAHLRNFKLCRASDCGH
ncbi:MAG: Uncharacterised protein [Rhodobiaceae bacterium UBA7378]|nr:MAG: Uncharacterised protein [Rhodobiaceae bacterium UBA7378]